MSTLWYRKPAEIWEEALPLGNGRLGAMVFGGVDSEWIQVNEESMWYGAPRDRHNPDAPEALPKVRKLIEEGKPLEAQQMMGECMTSCPAGAHPYQTLGNLRMWFAHEGDYADYKRSLCLETAVTFVTYRVGDTTYTREMFISKPADCMVMRFAAEGNEKVNFTLKMDRGHYFDGVGKNKDKNGIFLHGNLGCGGFSFGMMVNVKTTDGTWRLAGESLIVENASEAILYFGARTTYREPNATVQELESCLADRLNRAASRSYGELLKEHVADYKSLFDRVELSLNDGFGNGKSGVKEEQLPTDERLKAVSEGAEDCDLMKVLFDYGRYLLISCSRPGDLPANLQGIWNKDFEPAWDSKYTININTQMNYWPAEVCNLSECHEPLFELLEKVRINGRKTAKVMYDCRGFLAHHNTDIHGDSAPQDLWYPATYWTLGGAWLCTHLWTHYLYTKDEDFLKKSYPTILEAALFFVDFLTPYKEYLVTNPSVSPENTYILPNGQHGCCCLGPTMDNQILRDLFSMCLEGEKILGPKAYQVKIAGVENTEQLLREIEQKMGKLAPTRIGSDGRILEWMEEYEEEEPGHRHISHLYGLFPSDQISVDETPKLAAAAEKTLAHRLQNGGGHTGWSRAWITNHYAKLWDGQKAYDSIEKMLVHSTYPNLFDKHPPFQIDGNFGVCAAIANMLVQSNLNRVVLLPALPKQWKNGQVKGLCLVGNATVSMTWLENKLLRFTIQANKPYKTCVKYQEKEWMISLEAGESIEVQATDA